MVVVETFIPGTSVHQEVQSVIFVARMDILNGSALKKKGQGRVKMSKNQHTVEVELDPDNSEYEDNYDLSIISVHSMNNQELSEVFASTCFTQMTIIPHLEKLVVK